MGMFDPDDQTPLPDRSKEFIEYLERLVPGSTANLPNDWLTDAHFALATSDGKMALDLLKVLIESKP
jgi:hypothetical protein